MTGGLCTASSRLPPRDVIGAAIDRRVTLCRNGRFSYQSVFVSEVGGARRTVHGTRRVSTDRFTRSGAAAATVRYRIDAAEGGGAGVVTCGYRLQHGVTVSGAVAEVTAARGC